MTKPTLPPVYNKLFEDGDFYITDHKHDMVGFERDSVIIHPCPSPDLLYPGDWPDIPFNLTMIMPQGESEVCLYCNQVPSKVLTTVYKLQNFDYFANDYHDERKVHIFGTQTRRFSSKIM